MRLPSSEAWHSLPAGKTSSAEEDLLQLRHGSFMQAVQHEQSSRVCLPLVLVQLVLWQPCGGAGLYIASVTPRRRPRPRRCRTAGPRSRCTIPAPPPAPAAAGGGRS